MDETKVTANLPTATVEMIVRDYRDGDADVMTISLRATPSLQAFGNLLSGPAMMPGALMWANPLGLWFRMAEMAWRPWLKALTPPAAGRIGNKPGQG